MNIEGIERSQKNFSIKISGPKLENTVVIRIDIHEKVSDLFLIKTIIQSKDIIEPSSLINKPVCISMEYYDKKTTRYFSGIVSRGSIECIPIREQKNKETRSNYIICLEIVPTLFRLVVTTKYRIFQELSAMDIIDKVLKENNISNIKKNITSSGKRKREFCVQYDETDFHFISRLMEEEGIFYYFEHEKNKDILHISDKSLSSKKIGQPFEILKHYNEEYMYTNYVYNVSQIDKIGVKKIFSMSFNENKSKIVSGKSENNKQQYNIGEHEIYDYTFDNSSNGDKISKILLEYQNSKSNILNTYSSSPEIYTGSIFSIKNSPIKSQNGDFFVIEMNHTINLLQNDNPSFFDGKNPLYENKIVAIPSQTPYRPEIRHLKTRIWGNQTAIVTGTSGEEIFCDKYARIKVRFHWDSRAKNNEKSSCWIRVSQNWSGKNFGSLVIPRIGMEVIINFINGDPDQPIVTGCLYNGVNKPPQDYPKKKKTVSTFYSNSSKNAKGFNELRFDDQKDKEEIFIHAQKDFNSIIENNVSQIINNGRKETILESKKEKISNTFHIKKGDNIYKIDEGDNSLTIKKGNNITTINEGNYTIILNKGNRSITLKEGNQSITLNKGNLDINIKGDISISADNIKINASKDISINAKGSIKVDAIKNIQYSSKDAISFSSVKDFSIDAKMNVKINAKMNINIESKISLSEKSLNISRNANMTISDKAKASLSIESSAIANFKGGAMTTLQSSAMMMIKGSIVKLN